MVSIPSWLTNSEEEQRIPRGRKLVASKSPHQQFARMPEDSETEIPIFCKGGCGEVVGYLPKGRKESESRKPGQEQWCPACIQAKISEKRLPEAKVSTESKDELTELRKTTRNLGWFGLVQAMIVVIIISGSIFIATGQVVGIYLAVIGTIAWCISSFLLRHLRD